VGFPRKIFTHRRYSPKILPLTSPPSGSYPPEDGVLEDVSLPLKGRWLFLTQMAASPPFYRLTRCNDLNPSKLGTRLWKYLAFDLFPESLLSLTLGMTVDQGGWFLTTPFFGQFFLVWSNHTYSSFLPPLAAIRLLLLRLVVFRFPFPRTPFNERLLFGFSTNLAAGAFSVLAYAELPLQSWHQPICAKNLSVLTLLFVSPTPLLSLPPLPLH